ncbi:hypothetical protein [Teredinibacter sp. KSP-S5-2]|uniref:hypothetical protein n=1 Tax=Teredinibacter sp. KSP-S5-2 TaxID=3034506 RepID=UPI002934E0B3|nr:hypothetical protein [Teredinibacter sp. KSP-S5-2]WNO07672.1 hypothetical protein P5V12_11790 [Teredinibacter sp. KSP-S5-2]
MTPAEKELGVIEVVLERIVKQRLPHALSLEKKVDAGEVLNEFDLEFLESVVRDGQKIKPIIDKHPEYQDLAARLMTLYTKIITKAAENENLRKK